MWVAIASDIMMSFCGVLKIHLRLASTGSTIVAEAAIEIIGVCDSAATSIIASEFGVVVEPSTMSTLLSVISFLRVGDRGRGVGGVVEDDVVDLLAADRLRHQRDRVLLRNAERCRRAGGRDGDADVDVGVSTSVAAAARPIATTSLAGVRHAVSPLCRLERGSVRRARRAHRAEAAEEQVGDDRRHVGVARARRRGFSQVNIQFIMPNSSIVSGLSSACARSSGRAAAIASAKAATTGAAPSSTRRAVGRRRGSARPRSGRGARPARRRRPRGRPRSGGAPAASGASVSAPTSSTSASSRATCACGDLEQQLLLVAEVVVERGLGDAAGLGHLVHRGRGVAARANSSAARARICSRWSS